MWFDLVTLSTAALVCCLPGFVVGRDCQKDSDCQEHEACIYNQCGDQRPFCDHPQFCGTHAACVARNHDAVCVCKPGFYVSRGAYKPCVVETECVSQQDCPGNQTCISGRCENVCDYMSCGQHAVCKTQNGFPSCHCEPGYVKVNSGNITADCVQCLDHVDCPGEQLCVSNSCVDVCDTSLCGPNSTCEIRNHHLSCKCVEGFVRTNTHNLTLGCQRPWETPRENKSYYLVHAPMPWFQAKFDCEQRGDRLATIMNEEENSNVLQTLSDHSTMWWIGGYCPTTLNCQWLTPQEPMSFKYFHGEGGYPWYSGSAPCVEFWKWKENWKWIDDYCERNRSSICEHVEHK